MIASTNRPYLRKLPNASVANYPVALRPIDLRDGWATACAVSSTGPMTGDDSGGWGRVVGRVSPYSAGA
jgi:hypothetical protein